jgi:hypothetical protein
LTTTIQKPIFSNETKEYFKSLDLSFMLFPQTNSKSYVSLDHFYAFIVKELEFWQGCTTGKTSSIRAHFQNIKSYLDQIKQNESNQQQVKSLINQVVGNIKLNRFPCIYSFTTTAKFIRQQYEIKPALADAACEYLFNLSGSTNHQFQSSMNNKDFFSGLVQAYFYEYPGTAKSLFKSEKDALEGLQLEYTNSLNTLDFEYHEKKKTLVEKNIEYHNELTTWKENFQNEHTNWKENLQDTTENFIETKKKELEQLTKLYEEKLKLEAPAKYWEDTSNEYEMSGKKWMGWTIVTSIVFVAILTTIFFLLPSNITGFNFNSVKMTIILAVIISVGIFVINFFIRLSTSAFHLSRDAKERNKLAYVYLALLHEKGVDESDRAIILQSLFSRADTGLLKGDSSPTLPDGLIGQVLKSIGTKQ